MTEMKAKDIGTDGDLAAFFEERGLDIKEHSEEVARCAVPANSHLSGLRSSVSIYVVRVADETEEFWTMWEEFEGDERTPPGRYPTREDALGDARFEFDQVEEYADVEWAEWLAEEDVSYPVEH